MKRETTRKPKGSSRCLERSVSRRREEQALLALMALALRNGVEPVTEAEIAKYTSQPVKLSAEDEAALKRARPEFLKALRVVLRPDAKEICRQRNQAC